MSVLLVGLDAATTAAVAERLLAQGDEVRVIETNEVAVDELRRRGVYVARGGAANDPDLIERAAQNVRTIVVGEHSGFMLADLLGSVAMAAPPARVERLIVVTQDPPPAGLSPLRTEHVFLTLGKKRRFRAAAVMPADIARAVDAADDLQDLPGDRLDLSDAGAWSALKLEPPAGLA